MGMDDSYGMLESRNVEKGLDLWKNVVLYYHKVCLGRIDKLISREHFECQMKSWVLTSMIDTTRSITAFLRSLLEDIMMSEWDAGAHRDQTSKRCDLCRAATISTFDESIAPTPQFREEKPPLAERYRLEISA